MFHAAREKCTPQTSNRPKMEQSALEPQDEVWVFIDQDGSRSDWLRGCIAAVHQTTVDVSVNRGQVREVESPSMPTALDLI